MYENCTVQGPKGMRYQKEPRRIGWPEFCSRLANRTTAIL